MPVGVGLCSPAVLLFNRPPQYEALKACQDKYVKDSDTLKDLLSFPVGSTVSMQYGDGGPWTCGIIEEANNNYHNGKCYVVTLTKTGRLIMQNTRHICNTPITTEQYLWEQIPNEQADYSNYVHWTHRCMLQTVTDEGKIIVIHQVGTGGRKRIMLLPCSRAR